MTTTPDPEPVVETADTDRVEPAEPPVSRDAAYWSAAVDRLNVADAPAGALNLNVSGRRVTSPVQGFGKLWQKTYRVRLDGAAVSPAELVALWKAEFGSFWPTGNSFHGSLTGIAPGDVALLNLTMPGGVRMSTGVLVLYADDESFTFMTPEGHMFASWITFSAERDADTAVAQIQVLLRAGDPLYELGMPIMVQRKEDRFWQGTLLALAARVGVDRASVDTTRACIDRRRQWRNFGSIRHNAAIRSGLYAVTRPFARRR